jgi:hypothetical protein
MMIAHVVVTKNIKNAIAYKNPLLSEVHWAPHLIAIQSQSFNA